MKPAPTSFERDLSRRAADWPEHSSWKELTVDVLRGIAAREGSDFATALLHDRLVRSPEHGPFIARVEAISAENLTDSAPGRLVIVPGLGYVEYPQTGADGRRLRESAQEWGWRVETVPVASFGSLSANSRAVSDWLAGQPRGPVVLVSLSKGGADVKTALASRETAATFREVRVWLDLSGILHGTPLAGWLLLRWYRRLFVRLVSRYRRFDFSIVRELDRDTGSRLAADLIVPYSLRVVHVVGFPLFCHLNSRRARRGHRRLAVLGPNDGGGILLGDLCRLPGLISPVWGADHYLEPSWDLRPLIRCVLHAALEECSEPGALTSCRGQVL
jgi:hypothetical protein